MADPDLFKLLLQGGSTGLLAIIIVGGMRALPAIFAAINKLGDDHREGAKTIAEGHLAAIEKLSADCREERRELVQQLVAEARRAKPEDSRD